MLARRPSCFLLPEAEFGSLTWRGSALLDVLGKMAECGLRVVVEPVTQGKVSWDWKVCRLCGKDLRRVELALDTSSLVGNSSVGRILGNEGGGGGNGRESEVKTLQASWDNVPLRIWSKRDTKSTRKN